MLVLFHAISFHRAANRLARKMKLLLVSVLAIVWLFAISESVREKRGHRGRQDSFYNLKRYVHSLQGCLRDARIKYEKLEATNKELEAKVEECEEDAKCCK